MINIGIKESQRSSQNHLYFFFVFRRGIHQIQGYSRKGREILENENVMEAKESLDIQTCDGRLPDSLTPKLRPALENLSDEAKLLAQRLLRCLALDLKIDPQSFLSAHAGMLTGTLFKYTIYIFKISSNYLQFRLPSRVKTSDIFRFFAPFLGEGNASAIRLLHYPPLDKSEGQLQNLGKEPQKITRCGKHTDYGGLTLLFQVRLSSCFTLELHSTMQF